MARAPVDESERITARLNALYAIREGRVFPTRRPSYVWPGAVDEACELGYAEPGAPGFAHQLTERGWAFLEALE